MRKILFALFVMALVNVYAKVEVDCTKCYCPGASEEIKAEKKEACDASCCSGKLGEVKSGCHAVDNTYTETGSTGDAAGGQAGGSQVGGI